MYASIMYMKNIQVVSVAVVSTLIIASVLFLFGAIIVSRNNAENNDTSTEDQSIVEERLNPLSTLQDNAQEELENVFPEEMYVDFVSNTGLERQIKEEFPELNTVDERMFCRDISGFDRDLHIIVDFYNKDRYVCTDIRDSISLKSEFNSLFGIPSECLSATFTKYESKGVKYLYIPDNQDLNNTWAELQYSINGEDIEYNPMKRELVFDLDENVFTFNFINRWHTADLSVELLENPSSQRSNPGYQTPAINTCTS